MIEITSASKELQLSYQKILKLYNHVTMEAHLQVVIKYSKKGESVQMNSFYYHTVKPGMNYQKLLRMTRTLTWLTWLI